MRLFLLLILPAYLFAQQVDDLTQIKRPPTLDARAFQFLLTNGVGVSGDLTAAGAKTVILSLSPLGVNGSDGNHSVLISGGTGTAESPVITGGTCVAGGTFCTLTFTTVNAHSGAWQMASATAGGSEAISYAPSTGAVIYMPAGPSTMTGSLVVVNKFISLRGESKAATKLNFGAGLTQSAIRFVQGGVPYPDVTRFEISDMTISSASTTQPCVEISGIQEAQRLAHDMYLTGCSIGLKIGGGASGDTFDHLIINDVGYAGIDAEVGNGGGHFLDYIIVGTVGQSEPQTQFTYGIHAFVATNMGSQGGISISHTSVLATPSFGPTTAYLFENQSGIRNPYFLFMHDVVADGTYNTDAFVFRNIESVNASMCWSVNHAGGTAAAWKIDNSGKILISGASIGWSAGLGAFAFANASDNVSISDTIFDGTAVSLAFTGANSTNLHLGTGNQMYNAGLTNSTTGLVAALNQAHMFVGPERKFFSSTSILDEVWINTDAGATNNTKYWRVNVAGGIELINHDHSRIIHTIGDDGTISGPSGVPGLSGSLSCPGGQAIKAIQYSGGIITGATCAIP